MLEEYFIKEYENLKKTNEELRNKITELENSDFISTTYRAVKMELIPLTNILEKLEKANIDYIEVVEEWNSKSIYDLICDFRLAKRLSDNPNPVVKHNNRFYTLEERYGDYVLSYQSVYITEDSYIKDVLVDKLYDQLNQHKKDQMNSKSNANKED